MLLSIVVPCHNEESVLDALVTEVFEAITAPDVDIELILVNDGSRDRTLEMMREHHARDPRVRFVSFSRNFGKEAAMFAGLSYAKGDAVVIMDADLQHPPTLVNEMIELHRQGYDQVVARRTRDGDPALRTAFSRLYYRLVNKLVDVPMEDGVGDFRLLSRRAVDALVAMRESNRFSKGLFSWIGFPRATIDYKNQERQGGGVSKWSMRRLFNYGIDGIMSFNNAPLRAAVFIGIGVTLLSLAYVVYLLVGWAMGGVDEPGYITLITAILGVGGLQLLFLGVIGEYVGRIYNEVKRRPPFIVSDAGGFELTTGDPGTHR
ncbi:MAG: glycosyltransferase family 2 protein [Actinomycetes bacterium]